MTTSLSFKAISAALNSSWQKAIEVNEQILNEDPKDIDALNRLAYAHLEMGKSQKAHLLYKKVLLIDPYNPIALKNIARVKEFRGTFHKSSFSQKPRTLATVFLEEPGKTKVVNLLKLGSKSVLVLLRIGDSLTLSPKKHYITVLDRDQNYVGSLPDDISFRLIDFIRRGNKYEVFVRSVEKNMVLVFLRETFRSSRMKNISSFLSKGETTESRTQNRDIAEEESLDNKEEISDEE